MKASPKSIIKYLVVLTVTGLIFWYAFRNVPQDKIKSGLKSFDYSWILLSIGISFISHFLRAWRWALLLKSSGHQVTTLNSYFAVMIGYLMNSVFPRLGEVARCGVINRTSKVPVAFSLGTVVTERFIDLMMLLLLTLITFILQYDLLKDYLFDAQAYIINTLESKWWVLALLILIGLIGIYILFFSKLARRINLIQKIRSFVDQIIQGVLSIRKLKNQKGFWLSTVGIWIMYFLMLYVITFGSDMTKDLGILAGMSILVMGSFGMATPIPNGIGPFHILVAGVLGLYGIANGDGEVFALIMHASQFITVLLFGSISLILVNVMYKPSKVGRDKEENQIERKPK